jgi:predicted RNA binding protein YcfA (HicA-like mRNA interferase family)
MPKIPPLNGHEVLRILLKAGFYVHHQSGSHARLFHNVRSDLRVTIPIHNKELPDKTLQHILKQADVSKEEFLRLRRS